MQHICSKTPMKDLLSGLGHTLTVFLVIISCLFAGGGLSGAAAEIDVVNPAWYTGTIWHQLETGLNGTVFSIVKSGNSYYVGGAFTNAGDIEEADYLARWDGKQWHAVAGGINDSVRTIAIKDTNIYIGGQFTEINGDTTMSHVAYWNGATWNSMAGGVDGTVYDLAVSGEYVYVGGSFSGVDANPDNNNIARWHDSSGWSVLGGELVGTVEALAAAGGQLFVGGAFTDAGGVEEADRVARYNGTWNALNTGFSSGTVYDLTMCGSVTYAAGSSGIAVSFFDTSLEPDAWVTMAGLGATVNTVDCLGGEIYAGGYFTDGGGDGDADYLAHWNGSAWEAVGAGFSSGGIFSILPEPNSLMVGGGFSYNNGNERPLNNIAQWSPSRWTDLGISLNESVYAVAISGGNTYIGGAFTDAGAPNMDYLIFWDGSTWHPASPGGPVYALEPYSEGVLVGGDFIDANLDAELDYNITYFNGTSFEQLDRGVGPQSSDRINAIAVSGTDIYAAGAFTSDGRSSIAMLGVAKYSGGSWSSLGTGLEGGTGYALEMYDDHVVVGGIFTGLNSNGSSDYIAVWDGDTWEPVGSGVNDDVYALAVGQDGLYAGGFFSNASGVTNTWSVARWDGSAWHALGEGITIPPVNAIVVIGPDVYVGGAFSGPAGIFTAAGIARWDGSSWHDVEGPFDSDQPVYCLAADGLDLIVGGYFENGGGVADMDHLARYNGIMTSFIPLVKK